MGLTIAAQDISITQDKTIREALKLLDKTAQGIIFTVDRDGRMTGVLTDGDIRRALLKDANLDNPIKSIIKRDFVSLHFSANKEEIFKHLSPKINHIPLLDDEGILVDYASFNRLHRIPVMEPCLGDEELSNVLECLKTNWISSQGKFVTDFENKFSEYHDWGYALCVSNGTVALHLALVSCGIGPGDEVIVPNLTFAASANAVIFTGAEPVFIDVDMDTWTLDPTLLERVITKKTKAIMPVHLYGHPCDMDPIIEFAERHGLIIIEDCAESFGARYKDKLCGTFGEANCFSFFGNKIITTGEGGMILFKNREQHEKAKCLRDHGMDPLKRYWHNEVGYNYRLTNLQAAIGVAQLGKADLFIKHKIENARIYKQEFDRRSEIILPPLAPWAKNIYWLYTVRLDASARLDRDLLLKRLLQNGIEARPVFYPLSEMPPYKKYLREEKFPVTEELSRTGLSLPSAITLGHDNIRRVCKAIDRILGVSELYNYFSEQEIKLKKTVAGGT